MAWRHSEILKLLESYRQYECLWNSHSPDYKQQEMRKGSWIALSKEFGKEVDDIKKKIKGLRNGFMAEKKKLETRKDSNGEPIYESHLYYYNQISFLDAVIVRKPPDQSYDPLYERKSMPLMSTRVVLTQKRGRPPSTDSEKEESQLVSRTSTSWLDSDNSSPRASPRFNPKPTVRQRESSPTDSEKEEPQLELETSISRLDCTNSSPKASPQVKPKPTVRRLITNDVPKTQPPRKSARHSMLSKEGTFCAMLCCELKLLKSEETYDNVTADIFSAIRSAKIADRQIEQEKLTD